LVACDELLPRRVVFGLRWFGIDIRCGTQEREQAFALCQRRRFVRNRDRPRLLFHHLIEHDAPERQRIGRTQRCVGRRERQRIQP